MSIIKIPTYYSTVILYLYVLREMNIVLNNSEIHTYLIEMRILEMFLSTVKCFKQHVETAINFYMNFK